MCGAKGGWDGGGVRISCLMCNYKLVNKEVVSFFKPLDYYDLS